MKSIYGIAFIFIFILFLSVKSYAVVSAQVSVIKLQKKSLASTLLLYGSVQTDPTQTTMLSLPVGGQVQQVFVKAGQLIQKDKTLFTFKPNPSAQLNYQQAVAALRLAKSELARIKRLFDQQLATRSQLANAQKALQDAQSSLHTAKVLGDDTTIKNINAPFDGVVMQLMINTGGRVQAGASLMQLGNCNHLIARLGADPSDVKKIRPGMLVKIKPFFDGNETLDGKIIQVSHQIDPNTRLVDVWAELSGGNCQRIFPGSAIQARVILVSKTVWAIPQSAVLKDQQGYYIYRIKNQHAERIAVKVLWNDEGTIAIENPTLATGDLIVIQGNYELKNHMAVRIDST